MGSIEKGVKSSLTLWMILVVATGIVLLIALPYLWLAQGLQEKDNKHKDKGESEENSLAAARDALAKNTDLTTCRSAIVQINSHLATNTDLRGPGLSTVQSKQFQELFG